MKSIYRYFPITIAAGEIYRINAFARFLKIYRTTGSQNILVSIGGQPFEELPQGNSIELPASENFTALEFRNVEASSVVLKIMLSAGKIEDSTATVNGEVEVDPSSNALESPSAIAVDVAAPGAPSIVADSTVRGVFLQNNGANPIWVGDANVDGANNRGYKIPKDGAVVIETSGDIYLRSTTGASTCSVLKLKKV